MFLPPGTVLKETYLVGRVLGHGLSAYASAEAASIAGCQSSEIAGILGYRGRDELIHRDDLVLFGVRGL